jgi:HEAT repeat protein
LARRITNLLLLGAIAGAVAWQAASRGPEIITYWQDVARVGRAERALDRGDRRRALQLLGQAGKPGEERLGRLLVASHSRQHWPLLVGDLRRAWPATRDAVAGALNLSPEERLCAAEALAAVGDRRGISALASSLANPSPGAHQPADLVSLGKAGCEALVNVARFGPRKAREQALLLLSVPDEQQAERALLDLVTDDDFPQRVLALRALAPYQSDRVDQVVTGLTEFPDPEIRAEAVLQHAKRKGPDAFPDLARALRDEDSRVRLAAVDALCTADGREGDRLLMRALSDRSPRVVRRAVAALGRRQVKEAAPAIAQLYADASRELKHDIAMALCWMDSPLGPEYRALWEAETGQQLVLSSAWDG